MKFNSLILILLVILITTLSFKNNFDFDSPKITIENKSDFTAHGGNVIFYTISLTSVNELKNFSIQPSVKGANIDCSVNYVFDRNKRKVTVNYFYAIPVDADESFSVTLKMELKDSKKSKILFDVITLKSD